MSKRPLSPAPLPSSKRRHNLSHSQHSSDALKTTSTFDTLFDEIILVIFSYLAWTDLCAVQHTNRNWSRLSLDNQLWKSLYVSEFGRARLRGARGFVGRGDGRETKPLPMRAKAEGVKDWKWMFRISSNWRTGRCSLEHFNADGTSGLFSQNTSLDETHLLLAGNITIAASSRPSATPVVVLSSPAHPPHTLQCPTSRTGSPAHITALALDQSPPSGHHGRFVSFLSTGEFVLFSLDYQTPSASSRVFTFVPTTRNARTAPITQAVYHHPLLVTLSHSFCLSLYELSDDNVTLTQSLSSFTSYPPSSLVLSTPSPSTYKLVLAYAAPVYPAHWSIGATELIISASSLADRMTVTSTRTARAVDVPQGWLDENKMRAVREQWGRKVTRVADTQTDGKWVVLAPGHDPTLANPVPPAPPLASTPRRPTTYTSSCMHTAYGLQLYRLHLPASITSSSGSTAGSTGSSSTGAAKLTFVRTLHGHIGPISTLALADGRCVSLGVNGSIWVWDLEGGVGTEVSAGVPEVGEREEGEDGEDEDEDDGQEEGVRAWEDVLARLTLRTRGAVVFDDRQIVSASGRGVQVRRFDI